MQTSSSPRDKVLTKAASNHQPAPLVRVRVSPTIDNEYAVRGVFGGENEWPLVPDGAGTYDLPRSTAQAMLDDAVFQVCVDGPFGPSNSTREDLPIRNAYTALVKQLLRALGAEGAALSNGGRQ